MKQKINMAGTLKAKITNVEEYISTFPKEVQKVLKELRKTIKKAAPEAEEVMSYGMPALKLKGMLVYYAAWKEHIGFYALPSGNAAFKKELSRYESGKGSVKFPLDQPMPLNLITKIIQFRVKENLEKANVKKKK